MTFFRRLTRYPLHFSLWRFLTSCPYSFSDLYSLGQSCFSWATKFSNKTSTLYHLVTICHQPSVGLLFCRSKTNNNNLAHDTGVFSLLSYTKCVIFSTCQTKSFVCLRQVYPSSNQSRAQWSSSLAFVLRTLVHTPFSCHENCLFLRDLRRDLHPTLTVHEQY